MITQNPTNISKIRIDFNWYLTDYAVYKTEAFSIATSALIKVNDTIFRVASCALRVGIKSGVYTFKCGETAFDILFSPNGELPNGVTANGAVAVCFGFHSYPVTASGDARLVGLKDFDVERTTIPQDADFKKMYRTFAEDINLPLLNDVQRAIVTTADKNILVQGVAGSGKTNICIDKIVFSAVSGYGGKTLYSTFSRGLLLDVKDKVDAFAKRLDEFAFALDNGRVTFANISPEIAVGKLLGVALNVGVDISAQLASISDYLKNKVDYLLIEDMFRAKFGECKIADESHFKTYLKDIKNYNLKQRIAKHDINAEVLYKEIYGYIFGKAIGGDVSFADYLSARENVFSKDEIRFIFDLASAYKNYLANSGAKDLNAMSAALAKDARPKYSVVILDEVQDLTEVQLDFMRKIGLKIFAVGDALQMVNPSYFSFAKLKDMLYKKDVTEVSELVHNYRNSKKIAEIVQALSELNRDAFGVHSFVLKTDAVSDSEGVCAIFFKTEDFAQKMGKEVTDNFTVVVSTTAEKEKLRKILPEKEILTVSEIKGLERDTIVLYNILSENKDKWERLDRLTINRKNADENSLYRYYFNLFYVGLSRARRHLFVAESEDINRFDNFFQENFERYTAHNAVQKLKSIVGSTLVEQNEHLRRATEFMKLGQYDNAFNAANRLVNNKERDQMIANIEIWRDHISHGAYRDAGIAFWEKGMINDAKKYFEIANAPELVELVSATSGGSDEKLDYNILLHLPTLMDNPSAVKIILGVISKDLTSFKESQANIKTMFKTINKKSKGAN